MRGRVDLVVLGLADSIKYKSSIIPGDFVPDVFPVFPCELGHE
jgi:hypothetical protein